MNTQYPKLQDLQIELTPYSEKTFESEYDLDRIIHDLDSQIDLLSSQADKLDYLIAVSSGILCGMLDILWVGDFSLERGRDIASSEINDFVTKTAKFLGCKEDGLDASVKFLEGKFSAPSDGNMSDFGGSLQHHFRDFAHHPTIVGLMFSLLTQFTYKSYGTDVNGVFKIVDVPEMSRQFIGNDVPTKILYGVIYWFFHLVSDIAGSSSSIALNSSGTGIPGPLLALVKELSALPFFKNMTVGDNSLSVFLSKLFNGTLLAKRDESNAIIKDTVLRFDLRGELGLGLEIGRQATPVVANECFVRCFYFIRRLGIEIRKNDIRSLEGLRQLDWGKFKMWKNPTISRMLSIATGVFTTIDITESIITRKYWISVNYIGIGRFSVAIGEDVAWLMKARNIKKIKEMYENIKRFVYIQSDENNYGGLGSGVKLDKLGLTAEQTEILYNLEYYKTLHDIGTSKAPISNETIKLLKSQWLEEWKEYITKGFSSFLQIKGAKLNWYTEQDLIKKIEESQPENTWFRLVLLEAMLFEPYFPLGIEKNKKGEDVPSKKYNDLQNVINGFNKGEGDDFLDSFFSGNYYTSGYIKRLRKCYRKVILEMKEVLKGAIVIVGITSLIAIVAVATAGTFAGPIAVILVGSNFGGLSGAALTSACLAYLGGGAIAAGGLGMAGGVATIVGGGAIIGASLSAGVGGAVGIAGLLGKQNTILQSAKLLVSVREIFLNDEHDVEFANSIYDQYVKNIMHIEKGLVELKLQADVANSKEKKQLKDKIKKAEESVEVMKIARKSLWKFISSFEEGYARM